MFKSSTSNVAVLRVVTLPLTVKSPVITTLPPTFKFLATPTPPNTINAPLALVELSVVAETLAFPVVIKLFCTVVLPVAPPTLSAVAAPNAFTVVATVL